MNIQLDLSENTENTGIMICFDWNKMPRELMSLNIRPNEQSKDTVIKKMQTLGYCLRTKLKTWAYDYTLVYV